MRYTKEQIIQMLNEMSLDVSFLYKKGLVNYTGKTSDTKELYTEVIASWLLENIDLLENIKCITRNSSYRVVGHDGVPEHPCSNRKEELIAMSMMRQGNIDIIGKIIDYQTPLKNCRSDKVGKIDLLAYDGKTLHIFELKDQSSKETMLRCVLEGYTYFKTVDKIKLVRDFDLPYDTLISVSPLTFYGGFQWQEMNENRGNLKKLMGVLKITPYYIVKENDYYKVVEE